MKILNIIGPSGSGKTTLVHEVLKNNDNIAEIVSDTSREMRVSEEEGKDYYFKDKETMLKMYENNEYVEFNSYADNLYGVRKSEITNKFKNNTVLFVITDINGNKMLKKSGFDIVTIFIGANETALKERLRMRTESPQIINKRIERLSKELQNYKYADFVIYNDDFNKAYNELLYIIKNIFL